MKKEFRDILTENIEESSLLLLSIPYDRNASIGKGASLAPKKIKSLSYHVPATTMEGKDISSFKIFDCGEVKNLDNEDVFSFFKKICAITVLPFIY